MSMMHRTRYRKPTCAPFEEVILPHLNAAYNLARWLTRNEYDAQDVVQEAYLRAFRFFDGYHGGDGKSWLLGIVRNTCFTFLRREKRNLTMAVFDEATHASNVDRPNQEEALVEAAKRTVLQDCIEKLPEEFREILVIDRKSTRLNSSHLGIS